MEPNSRLNPMNLRSWPELKWRVGHLTDWVTQVPLFFFFLNVYLFILKKRERERETMSRAGAENRRENLKQAPCCQHRTWCKARSHKPWDHDVSWSQESDSQPAEPPRHPCGNFFIVINMDKQFLPSLLLPFVPSFLLSGNPSFLL